MADRARFPIRREVPRWAIWVVLLIAVADRAVGVGRYAKLIYDEYYYVPAAALLSGHRYHALPNSTAPLFLDPNLASHPPFAKEIVAAVFGIGGIHPWLWRMPGSLLGASVVLPVYWLANELWDSPTAALLAAIFECIEGLAVSISHVFLLDSIAFPLAVWSLWAVWRLCRAFARGSGPGWMAVVAAGILMGLGLSAKWTGGQTLLVAGGSLGVTLIVHRHRLTPWAWLKWALAVVVVPFLTYFVTYLYAWPKGFDQSWLSPRFVVAFFQLQITMFHNMWGLDFFHPGTSSAWNWLVLPRPLILLDWFHGGTQSVIMTLPDPLMVWAGVVALAASGWWAWQKRIGWGAVAFVWWWFVIFYPLWLISPRSKFLYYFLPATVPLILALAFVLTRLIKGELGRRWRWAGGAAAAAVLASALCLLPMTAGFAMPPGYQKTVWVPQWNPKPSPSSASGASSGGGSYPYTFGGK